MEVVLKDGIRFCVGDDSLKLAICEAFERIDSLGCELAFVRRICTPSWNVLDVGGYFGLYSLTLAAQEATHVWVAEPPPPWRECFRQTIERNGFADCVSILPVTASGSASDALVSCDPSLGPGFSLQSNESITAVSWRVSSSFSIDTVSALIALPSIDFVSIDVEDDVLSVVQGGLHFFTRQSPLVFFRYEAGAVNSPELLGQLRALNYEVYTLVPGLSCLRRLAFGEESGLDLSTQNLFACKPDRAATLATQGALMLADDLIHDVDGLLPRTPTTVLAMPMVDDALRLVWQKYECSGHYGLALLAWCAAHDSTFSPCARYALLLRARQALVAAIEAEDHHPAVTILLARVLSDLGARTNAVTVANAFLDQMAPSEVPTDRPVPPLANPFDIRCPQRSLGAFLHQSVIEFSLAADVLTDFTELAESSYIGPAFASPERSSVLERWVVLAVAVGGQPKCGRGLRWLYGDSDNLNRELWIELAKRGDFYPYVDGMSAETLIETGDRELSVGDNESALRSYRQAADQQPDSADAHFKQGVALMRLDRWSDAADCFRRSLRLRPVFWPACNNLGLVLDKLCDVTGAENAYRKGLAEAPECFDLHFNFASMLNKSGRFTESLYYLRQAERINPKMACTLDLMGSTLILLSRTLEAIPVLQRALDIDSSWAQAWNNLGRCHFIRGDLDEADRCYRQSVTLAPDFLPAWTNRVMICNYRSMDPGAVFDLHRCFGERARSVVGPIDHGRWRIAPDKARRLRIGFVSADFRRHSVSYFIEGTLRHLDRSKFQLYAYFSHDHPDQRTMEFKPLFSLWRDVVALSDKELAEQIVADRIDILVDLTGHTTGSRLGVFAEKPAPVQLTWIGYPNTTGLDSIDYRLTDAIVDPEGAADQHCTEILWRLPRPFLCYSPPDCAPEVGLSPVFSKGYITFGSFNSRFKLGDETLALWSQVLKACPGSRMVIKAPVGLADEAARNQLRERFSALGVDESRIDVQEAIGDLTEHLALYNSVDIALDPYPYHGTTTTFEALWMGVPVVCLAGKSHAARVGVSILEAAGLPGLVASSADEYVSIAASLVSDARRLEAMRAEMRARLQASALLDAEGMAHDVGVALREMWHRFCDTPLASSLTPLPGRRDSPPIKLHVGGKQRYDGWKVLDAVPGAHVDFVGDVRDLSRFGDESCTHIYCSHVLEHLGQGDVLPVLESFYRLLLPGGRLSLSVPDLDTLAWLFVNPQYSKATKFEVMRRVFGGQLDAFDFHQTGFNFEFLCDYLRDAGFEKIDHVESLRVFDDASEEASFNEIPVSLNLIATK